MKACSEVSPYSGVYMDYAYTVGVKNKPAFMLCDSLPKVRTAWNYFHNEFPNANLYVHRTLVVADIDTQMRKKNLQKLLGILKLSLVNKDDIRDGGNDENQDNIK